MVTEYSTTGGVGVSNLVPYQGASIDLGFSATVDRKLTTDTTVNFVVTSKAKDASVCGRAKTLLVDGGIGFGEWLTSLAHSLDLAAAGDPKFAVSELDYQLVFSVTQSVNANGDFTIVIIPLKVSASALASRNDIQTLKIKMVPPAIVVGHDKNGKPITRPGTSHPFFVPIDPRSFSPMVVPGGGR